MIIGIGTDLVDIRRIAGVMERSLEKFVRKIFTSREQGIAVKQHCLASAYAKRFAGKEAFCKAVGKYAMSSLSWKDIEILRDDLGKPILHLSPRARDRFFAIFKSELSLDISLSDEYPYAQAFVIVSVYR